MATAGLDKVGYVKTVLDAMAAAQGEHPSIRAKLILSMDRRNTPQEAHEVVLLARQFRSRGVVGIDLCGDPAKGNVALFTPAVREAKAGGGLGVTIHFAEAECSASEAELQTIMDWDPDRLGHVIHVPEHIKQRIPATRPSGGGGTSGTGGSCRGLELCLSCNVHAKMIVGSFEAHHFREWWRLDGVTVVPCVCVALPLLSPFLFVVCLFSYSSPLVHPAAPHYIKNNPGNDMSIKIKCFVTNTQIL